jgi:hypothetical protein
MLFEFFSEFLLYYNRVPYEWNNLKLSTEPCMYTGCREPEDLFYFITREYILIHLLL